MRRTMVTAISIVVLGYGGLMAAETPAAPDAQAVKEKQLEKLGVMKGRMVAKSQAVASLLDNEANGASVANARITKLYGQVVASVNRQLTEENAKPQEMRNVALIDNLNKKSQKNAEMWNDFNVLWQTCQTRKNVLAGTHSLLYSYIFNPVRGIDEYCASAGVDLELLVPLLTAIEKRWDELKAELTEISANIKKPVTAWEEFTKE